MTLGIKPQVRTPAKQTPPPATPSPAFVSPAGAGTGSSPRRRRSRFALNHDIRSGQLHNNTKHVPSEGVTPSPGYRPSIRGLLYATFRVARSILPIVGSSQDYNEDDATAPDTKGVGKDTQNHGSFASSIARSKSLSELKSTITEAYRIKDRIFGVYQQSKVGEDYNNKHNTSLQFPNTVSDTNHHDQPTLTGRGPPKIPPRSPKRLFYPISTLPRGSLVNHVDYEEDCQQHSAGQISTVAKANQTLSALSDPYPNLSIQLGCFSSTEPSPESLWRPSRPDTPAICGAIGRPCSPLSLDSPGMSLRDTSSSDNLRLHELPPIRYHSRSASINIIETDIFQPLVTVRECHSPCDFDVYPEFVDRETQRWQKYAEFIGHDDVTSDTSSRVEDLRSYSPTYAALNLSQLSRSSSRASPVIVVQNPLCNTSEFSELSSHDSLPDDDSGVAWSSLALGADPANLNEVTDLIDRLNEPFRSLSQFSLDKPVQVSFPETALSEGHTEKYESGKEAVSSIMSRDGNHFDRFCIFDPQINVIFIHARATFVANPSESEALGYEVFRLPSNLESAASPSGQKAKDKLHLEDIGHTSFLSPLDNTPARVTDGFEFTDGQYCGSADFTVFRNPLSQPGNDIIDIRSEKENLHPNGNIIPQYKLQNELEISSETHGQDVSRYYAALESHNHSSNPDRQASRVPPESRAGSDCIRGTSGKSEIEQVRVFELESTSHPMRNPFLNEDRVLLRTPSRSVSETSSLSLASGFRFTQYCEQLAGIAHNGILDYVQECDTFPSVSLASQDFEFEVDLPGTDSGPPPRNGKENLQKVAVGEACPDITLGLVDILQTHGLMPHVSPRLRVSPGLKTTPFDERPTPLSPRMQPSPIHLKREQNKDSELECAKLEAFCRAFIDAEAD